MNCDQEKLAEKFIKKYKLDRNQHVEILDADDELIVRRVATLSLKNQISTLQNVLNEKGEIK